MSSVSCYDHARAEMVNGESEIGVIREEVFRIPDVRRAYLFGSRARGDAAEHSDYDVLVVVSDSCSQRERMRFGTECRRKLASVGIDADILVKSETQIEEYGDKLGSVIHAALREGVAI